MLHKVYSWMRTVCIVGLFTLSSAAVAGAASPTVVWQTTEGGSGVFSGDGTSILLRIATGFQMRRTSDGTLEKTITLPVGYQGYDAHAFSPDKTYVGTTIRANGITRIDLWRVSDGALARTINSAAVRNNKSLDISSTGLIEAHERFAYGDGGRLRIFRVSDGSLVTTLGPYCRNSSPRAFFAPNGQYLAVQDQNAVLARVLRTSNWSTAFTVASPAFPFAFAPNSATFWAGGSFIYPAPWQQVNVPAGTVVRSVLIDESKNYPSAMTPDGRYFLSGAPTQDKMEIHRTSDAGAQVSYTVGTNAWPGVFNPSGTLFTYAACPISGTPCVFYVASTPTLP
jgi:hypothetical protein